jgi:NTP pyrophosphatase (non-canonical NTP hydrolase)
MPLVPDTLDSTIETLLATAERSRRLAGWTTDRQATRALLQLAEECEEKAEELRKETCG